MQQVEQFSQTREIFVKFQNRLDQIIAQKNSSSAQGICRFRGGGEYRADNVTPNAPEDSHRNAQIFSPPYLFKGPRPVINSAPAAVTYGERFDVGTSQADQIGAVRWIRLSSVTHSFNENLHVNLLQFTAGSGKISVTAPASANA